MKVTTPLKENYLFRRAYQRGKSEADGRLVLYVYRSRNQGNRLGLTVSTKVGNAVIRNRVRRRLREIYRFHEDRLNCGMDIVVVARVRAAHSKYSQLEYSFLKLADKLELLKKEKEQP